MRSGLGGDLLSPSNLPFYGFTDEGRPISFPAKLIDPPQHFRRKTNDMRNNAKRRSTHPRHISDIGY